MRRIHPTITKEAIELQRAAGRWHPGLGFFWRRRWCAISAGCGDEVTVWQEGESLFVLSTNYQYGYAGLSQHFREEGDWDVRSETFLQGVEEEYPDFFVLSAATQRRILEAHL